MSVLISGVTIVTPIRNNPGRVRSPHANVWAGSSQITSPRGKKAGIRSQIDLPNALCDHQSQAGVRGRDERGRLFGPVLIMSCYYYYYSSSLSHA